MNAPKASGKALTPDPDRAPLVRRAFEDFASGSFTSREVREKVTALGLRTRRGKALTSQSFSLMIRNPIYIGRIESPKTKVSMRGNCDPLVTESIFYRAQAVLSGRGPVPGPRKRNHPDFPLRGFVRCEACGKPLTGGWSKGARGGHYAYYVCSGRCRYTNVSKSKLEGLFAQELKVQQPTPGYMRLLKDRVLHVWQQRKSDVERQTSDMEHRAKTIEQKLDRLDEAFIYATSIDSASYERQRDRLREELKLTKIERHANEFEELDVEGILAFAERVLPSAADLWVQASLNQRQRLQQLFFPDGVVFDGYRLSRTATTARVFNYLPPAEGSNERVVDQTGIEPVIS